MVWVSFVGLMAGTLPARRPAENGAALYLVWWLPAARGVDSRTHRGARNTENPCVPSNVLIVDDHPGFRASARRLLASHGYEIVGEAASGKEALEAVRSLEPQLVLLDVGLPDADGIELARALSERHPEARVVVVSSRDREEVEPLLDGAGAAGFIPKAELSASALRDLLD